MRARVRAAATVTRLSAGGGGPGATLAAGPITSKGAP